MSAPVPAAAAWELPHAYGERVHILDNAHLLTVLARLSGDGAAHPELPELVRTLYRGLLLAVCGRELPRVLAEIPTRMAAAHPRAGVYRGPILDPATRVVVADVVRGGIVPAQTCFELLCSVLPPAHVRLDHLAMQRVADASGRVVGVDLFGSKIGGPVEGAYLLLPDPMGATGATTVRALEHYREAYGRPARIIAMPMIATPEYLTAVLGRFPELTVYTVRLDRGLSPPHVLRARPGELWDEERGLDEKGYIVPGAGGIGEVMNNAWC